MSVGNTTQAVDRKLQQLTLVLGENLDLVETTVDHVTVQVKQQLLML